MFFDITVVFDTDFLNCFSDAVFEKVFLMRFFGCWFFDITVVFNGPLVSFQDLFVSKLIVSAF